MRVALQAWLIVGQSGACNRTELWFNRVLVLRDAP
jgi:hypothetical protein